MFLTFNFTGGTLFSAAPHHRVTPTT